MNGSSPRMRRAENFFTPITKPQIIAAMQEAKGTPGMKKAELANLAEREIAGTSCSCRFAQSAPKREVTPSATSGAAAGCRGPGFYFLLLLRASSFTFVPDSPFGLIASAA